MRFAALGLCVMAVLGACRAADAGSGAGTGDGPVPALRASGDDHEVARISAVLAEMLGVERVDLAADAFRSSSVLTIERRPLRRLEGRVVGREMSIRPERFQLRLEDGGCELVNLDSGARLAVPELDCVPEADPPRH